MDRCDGGEWSDEELFLGETQRYVESTSSQERVVQPSQEEEVMEEFEIDDSFEDCTLSFLEVTSQDWRKDQTQVQGDEDGMELGQSKDDLEKSRTVLDRTEHLLKEGEDPGHSRVNGEQRSDSKVGVTRVRMTLEDGQDGAIASISPDTMDQTPSMAGGSTVCQTMVGGNNQFTPAGRAEESVDVVLNDSPVGGVDDTTLLEVVGGRSMDDQRIRGDQGQGDEEPEIGWYGPRLVAPSMGGTGIARLMDRVEEATLLDSTDASMIDTVGEMMNEAQMLCVGHGQGDDTQEVELDTIRLLEPPTEEEAVLRFEDKLIGASLPESNSHDMLDTDGGAVGAAQMLGEDPGQGENVQIVGLDETKLVVPSIGGSDRPRLRDRVKEDVLLDTNTSGGADIMEPVLGCQDTNKPDPDTPPVGRGVLSDVSQAVPSVGLCVSLHSQLASQPPIERHAGQNNVECSNDVLTLGKANVTRRVGGKGVTDQAQHCVHTRGGVCSTHGPGAKWCWEPLPMSKRRLGPNGKMITRRHFWRCEVNAKGKMMTQTRLPFKKKDDDDDKKGMMMMGDNAGTQGRIQ